MGRTRTEIATKRSQEHSTSGKPVSPASAVDEMHREMGERLSAGMIGVLNFMAGLRDNGAHIDTAGVIMAIRQVISDEIRPLCQEIKDLHAALDETRVTLHKLSLLNAAILQSNGNESANAPQPPAPVVRAEPASERIRRAPVIQLMLAPARRPQERDLACLLLCDLSMSTDSWISNQHRVIDVVRDSAFLFCEALSATGDRFGVYGFSSVKRSHVRFHVVKDFASGYDAQARGRIAALKPGYYTRMGAAIRQAARILAEQPANRRLLLLLSDGKPNDLDEYDSRYGIEDTRMAVIEARRLGITPFCVTIDREGGAYLEHLFGRNGFQTIANPEALPSRLPKLYAELARRQ